MGRFARSWQLFKASLRVLRAHKRLAVFPVLSGCATLLAGVSFLTPAVFSVDENAPSDSATAGLTPATYALFIGFYLACAYVTIFFNAALISQAKVALSGGDPSVGGGLRVAGANWLRILPWALLSATVSLILRVVEERLDFLGRMVVGLIGMTWNLVTYLTLPVIVLERAGTRQAVKRSARLFRQTWGENVLGNAGVGAFGALLFIPCVLLIVLGAVAGGAVLLACALVALVWGVLTAVVIAALAGIYQTALYHYATEKADPAVFAGVGLQNLFPSR